MRITRKIKLVMKPLENNIMQGCCLKKLKEEKTWTIRPSNDIYEKHFLREKCPYAKFFLSLFSRILEIYGVFSPKKGKYGPEKTPYLETFHAVVP